MEFFLQSERLGFRRWTTEDLSLAQTLWGDPAVTAWLGGPFSPEAVRARLIHEIRQESEAGVQYWPLFLLENQEPVGCAGLRPAKLKNEPMHELGFHLRPAFWGKGLATEAARAVIEYAFRKLGLLAIFAGHHPSNAPSQHVLDKLGFAYAGDEWYAPSGIFEPTYLLLKTNWESHRI
jgi:RimJ/RimL family protein N-acetyltransferase